MSKKGVSTVIPCLNEEQSIGICIEKIQSVYDKLGVNGEIIVVDNGSTDKSAKISTELGAKVVVQPVKGYGAAYFKGLEAAKYDYIIMGDADDTYDFNDMPALLEKLDEGADIVMGSRFKGKILKGAMSFSHRYIGNPILSGLLNLFFHSKISDCHSGFRGLKKCILTKLNLKTTGMEFASEMIVAALRTKLIITEVPIVYYPRKGESKLEGMTDAWRHMRFLLIFSPNWLFLFPGLIFFSASLFFFILTALGWFRLFGHTFDVHAMIFFAMFTLLGFQVLNIGLFAKFYCSNQGFGNKSRIMTLFSNTLNLERALLFGSILCFAGCVGSLYIFLEWAKVDFIGYFSMLKQELVCLVLLVSGFQIIFSSFFFSLLKIPKN